MSDVLSLSQKLERVISTLARRLRQTGETVSPAQKTILSALSHLGPMTLSKLAEQLGVAAPTLTRMIDALENQSLVRRARDKKDRRVVYAVATREGSHMIRADRSSEMHNQLKQLSAKQRQQLEDALETLETLLWRAPVQVQRKKSDE